MINDLSCYSTGRFVFKKRLNAFFCINFSRKGYFSYNDFNRSHEEYNTRILVEKPGCEFQLIQEAAGIGTCTSFCFTGEAYRLVHDKYRTEQSSFFSNPDVFSQLIAASPELEYLHHVILGKCFQKNIPLLEIDNLVMEMLHSVMQILSDRTVDPLLTESNKKNHITTIERAKEYMMENFTQDISLDEIARHCYVSPFHFSRLFKQFSMYSPYQYLQHIRLKHAATLIRTTELPITDICYQSGFNRVDYFSSAFTKKYTLSPSKYKLCV